MKPILAILVSSLLITSCMEDGKIKVQNNVHNVKLESINFEKISVCYSLLPGQSSDPVKVTDHKESFPKISQLEFYMVSNGNRVYLKTKNKYKLDYGETLLIVISDTTKVINPLLE